MKLKIIVLTYFLIGLLTNNTAQQVIIKGNAKSYAGDSLEWNCYADQVTFKEQKLAQCKVKENGDFEFSFQVKETLLSFIHLNVFKGLLYIEPGKKYEIVLPQKVNKLPEDKLNPFFEESEFYVRILNADEQELNNKIKQFDRAYDKYLSHYFQLFKGKFSPNIVDTIIMSLDKEIPTGSNTFLKDYKEYSYATLQLMEYNVNKEELIRNYFYNKPVLYQNPAYMDIFNQLFNNYLSHFSNKKEGKPIPYFLIRLNSLDKIKGAMDSVEVLNNDTLQEMIISKSLFDNFYKEDFPQSSIISMLDTISLKASNHENKMAAKNILEKITRLLPGFIPPDYELPNTNGKLHSLSNSRNKFLYLSFVNPLSYTCQQELEVLKEMHKKKLEMLKIVSICVCENKEEMKKFVKEKGYKWSFLYCSYDNDLLKKYNIKVYPTYYLINPESNLAMSPAFPPTEPSFETRYFDLLKNWKQEIERRKAKEKGKGTGR